MKFQIASDIHLEFYANNLWKFIKQFKITGECLILAGDIAYPTHPIFDEFFEYIHDKYKHIFYVTGNHEYYQYKDVKTVSEIHAIIEEKLMKYSNIHFLNKQYYDFEHYRILGCTLWFYPENDKKEMNDYNYIYISNNEKLTNEWIEQEWKISREFVRENVHPKKINIVVSHHMPSYKMILPMYEKFILSNFYFASNCDDLFVPQIKYWICGHSHGLNEQEIKGVKCIMNAFGYPNEHIKLKSNLKYFIDI
jgi:predicted MPP superfamily phosphohydrolase